MHNDAVDSERGGDGPDRIGPVRVTASGLLTAANVKLGAWICFMIAALMESTLLRWRLANSLAWDSVDPFGLGLYRRSASDRLHATGRGICCEFFGVGAVCGTYWLCTGHLGPPAVGAGLAVGFLAGAVLLVNIIVTSKPIPALDAGRSPSSSDLMSQCGFTLSLCCCPFSFYFRSAKFSRAGMLADAVSAATSLVVDYRFSRNRVAAASIESSFKRCKRNYCRLLFGLGLVL